MARGARGGRGDGRWRDCSAEEMAREKQKEIVRKRSEEKRRDEPKTRRDEKERRKRSTSSARKGDGQHLDFSYGQSFVFPRSGFRVCYHSRVTSP